MHTLSKIVGVAALAALTACSPDPDRALAKQIMDDATLATVDSMGRAILSRGLNAGSGYSQVWARDMNTFVETALDTVPPQDIRGAILMFFALQQPNGEMVDGYVLKEDFTWYDPVGYYSDAAPRHVGFKNTVETDQETSLIQIVGKYVRKTGDKSILLERVAGRTVYRRIEDMIGYLMREKYDARYGLLTGALTADWGDVQPDSLSPCDITENSVTTIDAYDNAMLVIALDDLAAMTEGTEAERWKRMAGEFRARIRKHLWDDTRNKIIPHLYPNGGQPDLGGLDENQIHYHGGTAVAIEAGVLEHDEIDIVNDQMLENVRLSGMPSIGLTLYPTYPEGFFPGGMAEAYNYQNGGDWTWFGGRMIQQLVAHGYVAEAYTEIRPMTDRVIQNKGFYEWYGQGGVPSGSGHFKGSAGTLCKAIAMLRAWAEQHSR